MGESASTRWEAEFVPWRRGPLGVLSFRATLGQLESCLKAGFAVIISTSVPTRSSLWPSCVFFALLSIWAPELPKSYPLHVCDSGLNSIIAQRSSAPESCAERLCPTCVRPAASASLAYRG